MQNRPGLSVLRRDDGDNWGFYGDDADDVSKLAGFHGPRLQQTYH